MTQFWFRQKIFPPPPPITIKTYISTSSSDIFSPRPVNRWRSSIAEILKFCLKISFFSARSSVLLKSVLYHLICWSVPNHLPLPSLSKCRNPSTKSSTVSVIFFPDTAWDRRLQCVSQKDFTAGGSQKDSINGIHWVFLYWFQSESYKCESAKWLNDFHTKWSSKKHTMWNTKFASILLCKWNRAWLKTWQSPGGEIEYDDHLEEREKGLKSDASIWASFAVRGLHLRTGGVSSQQGDDSHPHQDDYDVLLTSFFTSPSVGFWPSALRTSPTWVTCKMWGWEFASSSSVAHNQATMHQGI